jgi:hypothetical protein
MGGVLVSVSPVTTALVAVASDDALAHGVIRADHTLRVPTATFDAFAEGAGWPRGLLKIDVEGARRGCCAG